MLFLMQRLLAHYKNVCDGLSASSFGDIKHISLDSGLRLQTMWLDINVEEFCRTHNLCTVGDTEDVRYALHLAYASSFVRPEDIVPDKPLSLLPSKWWKRRTVCHAFRYLIRQWAQPAGLPTNNWKRITIVDLVCIIRYWREYTGIGKEQWSKVDNRVFADIVFGGEVNERHSKLDEMLSEVPYQHGGMNLGELPDIVYSRASASGIYILLTLAARELLKPPDLSKLFCVTNVESSDYLNALLDQVSAQLLNSVPVGWLRPEDCIVTDDLDDLEDVVNAMMHKYAVQQRSIDCSALLNMHNNDPLLSYYSLKYLLVLIQQQII